ncbi:RNA polymerase sigma-70 factor, ECF subfamily [Chitinophaga jiangningensis]|uniref:RNA polymerase sigma-70 factor, ECF subfamily n=1 Tax=Chitinophaga jiangningensis TaxID=1419482 RepID=A0A1M7AFJ4_9BACT|nr:RNA polymerase sigma-70 factor [Chitinophaga jiangningensis]SHL41386.1 RNA polymerase sigma-70 factor, ECF subfamily [Chitinophaga jiangningensis]
MPTTEVLTDDVLLQRLKNGDEQALTYLYKTHWQSLFLLAYQLLKDREACKDLVQELFTELWQQAPRLEITTHLKAYLNASIKYKVFRYIRRQPANTTLFDQLEERMDHASPESELAYKELQQVLNTLIDHLPEKCRIIFRMSRDQQLSHKEIAARLNISVKTVENQITIAIRKLREAFPYAVVLLLISNR